MPEILTIPEFEQQLYFGRGLDFFLTRSPVKLEIFALKMKCHVLYVCLNIFLKCTFFKHKYMTLQPEFWL